VQKTQNNWRGRTIIGTAVFNENRQRIGTINDLLITEDGKVDQVLLSVGRARSKLVAVPFNQLRFAPTSDIAAPPVAADGAVGTPPSVSTDLKTYGIVLPSVTRESLASMEAFRFAP